MSYKRSTTFTGYKNRTVDKTEQIDLARKATALDKQRRETVKEFGQQAANQVTEMQRLSSLESQADQYELQNLSKFSQALRNALDTGARTLGVEYINRKRQEGIDNHRARLAGDPEATAKTALDAEQLGQIETKLKELELEKGRALTEVEKNNTTMSMEDRFRVENAKRFGSNFAYGYQKATLQEGAKGFMPWFQTSIAENEETVTLPDGSKIPVNQYNTLTKSEDRKVGEDKLLQDYITKVNNTTLSNLVVDQVLTKNITEQVSRWRGLQLDQEIKSNAANALEKKKIDIYNAITQFDGSAESQSDLIGVSIQDMFTNGRALQINKGVTRSAGLANREEIKETIIDALASIDDEQLREQVATIIFDKQEFEVPGVGKGILNSSLFGGNFDKDEIMVDIAYKIEQNKEKEQVKNKSILRSTINTLQQQWQTNQISATQYEIELQELEKEGGLASKVDNGMQLIATARTYKKTSLNVVNGNDVAAAELEKYGVITMSTWSRLPEEVRTKYEGKEATEIMWFETDEGKKLLKDFAEKSKNELTQEYSGTLATGDTLSTKSAELNNAIDFANDKYVWDIARALKGDPNVPKPQDGVNEDQYYFELATNSVLAQIQNAKNAESYQQNPFALEFGGQQGESKFKNPAFGYDNVQYDAANINVKKVLNQNDLQQAEKKIFDSQDGAVLFENGKLLSHLSEDRLQEVLQFKKTDDGIWASENSFMVQLALLDPDKRDVFTLGEMLRKQYIPGYEGIKIETLPKETQLIIEEVKISDSEIRGLLASPYAHDNARGIDMLGKVDNWTMTNTVAALGFTVDDLGDGIISDILSQPGMNITREEFDNNVDGAQNKVFKYHVNELLKEAASYTNDKLVMIQMVAIGMKGENMSNGYGQSRNKNLMNNALKTYYTGFSLSDDSELYSAFERGLDGKVKITNINQVSIENPTVTPATINKQIEDHLSTKPEEFVNGNTNKRNPKWVTWNAQATKLNAQKDVIELLNSDLDLGWGMGRSLLPSDTDSHFAWYATMEALGGKKRYINFLKEVEKKFIKETKYKISPRSPSFNVTLVGRKPIMDAWSNFVKKELLLTPEFFNLEVAQR